MSNKQTRQAALDRFLEDKHQEGDLIPHVYFWELFGLKQPKGDLVSKKAQLAFAGDMEWLKNRLFEHHMDLQNVRKEGYALVRWVERTDAAVTDSKAEIGRAIRMGIKRLESIPNIHMLNSDQQRRHDAGLLMLQHINAIRRNKNRFGEAN